MKLQTKLLFVLIFIFLTLFSATGYLRYRSLNKCVLDNLRCEANNIRGVLMATRHVYHHQFLESGLSLTDKTLGFLPAHAMSRISKNFSSWTDGKLYFNNVSDRPRNQNNVADAIEREAIGYFQKKPAEKERFVPFESKEGETFYHYSAPIWVEESCIKCHGKREDAPETIRSSYNNSYNYKIGDLRGIMSIKLPAVKLKAFVWTNFLQDLWVHLGCFVGMFFLISILLRRYVTAPLSKVINGLESVTNGRFDHPIEELSGEMAIVGKSFNRMSEQLNEREGKLVESEAKYRDLFDNASDMIQSVASDGRFIYVNKVWKETLGYNDDDVSRITLLDIISPDNREHCKDTIKRVLKGKNIKDVGSQFITKDGKKITVEGSINCHYEKGIPVATRSIFRDISERKHTEELIRRLSTVVEQSPNIVIITDSEGNIEYTNPKFTEVTGYTPEDVFKKNPRFLQSGNTPQEIYDELWKTIKSGKEWRGEFCNKKKNDELYFESAYISPLKDENDVIVNFVSVKEDITERKKDKVRHHAEHNVTKILAESETIKEASHRILQSICLALEWDLGELWLYDQQLSVLRVTEIWHLPSLDFSKFKDVTRRTTFSPQIGLPGRVLKSAKPVWIGDVVHDTNFSRASVAEKEGLHGAFGFPVISGNEVIGIICFYCREIRKPDNEVLNMMSVIGSQIGIFIKHKQAESALLQSERLKSIGTITAGISHEFNNILAIISGNVSLLDFEYNNDGKLSDMLNVIKKATKDGAEITSRMLKFSTKEDDDTKFVFADIRDLIKHAIAFTMPRWKNEAQVNGLSYHIDEGGINEAPVIQCNPTEIREVLVNLIQNALDAMPEGGSISFGIWSNEHNVFVSIADSGMGMTKDVTKKIFDPFFTTKRPQGTGLGLSTSYGIMVRHSGEINVKSEVGKGSTFILQFPLSTNKVSPKESHGLESKIIGKGIRILVVDDEKDICVVLDKLLSKCGHIVRTVDNGAEAIVLSRNVDYDLVLCDMAMPEVFGSDVIKAFNKLEREPRIGIITGWEESIKSLEEKGIKVDFILKKPFNLSVLIRHINDLVVKGIGD
ncbi:MAG: PAS domain S-box protein [Candidatus Brocadiaceae bacterium]|nr:PAS domain S-box protein [Candidatus Brocadiaceae bacterium]